MARKKEREKERKKKEKESSRNLCWTSPFLFFPAFGSLSFSSSFFHPPPFPPFCPDTRANTSLWLTSFFGGEKTLNTRDIFPWWSIRDRKLAAIDAPSRKKNRKVYVISSRGKSRDRFFLFKSNFIYKKLWMSDVVTWISWSVTMLNLTGELVEIGQTQRHSF